jgi:hypothetical protein
MSGKYTNSMYDTCAFQKNVKESTKPLSFYLDANKYVNCHCPSGPHKSVKTVGDMTDIESSLKGIDKIASHCDIAKHPNCTQLGCLTTNPINYISPYAYERGQDGENAVVTTNMKKPTNAGYSLPPTHICHQKNNQGIKSFTNLQNPYSSAFDETVFNNPKTLTQQENPYVSAFGKPAYAHPASFGSLQNPYYSAIDKERFSTFAELRDPYTSPIDKKEVRNPGELQNPYSSAYDEVAQMHPASFDDLQNPYYSAWDKADYPPPSVDLQQTNKFGKQKAIYTSGKEITHKLSKNMDHKSDKESFISPMRLPSRKWNFSQQKIPYQDEYPRELPYLSFEEAQNPYRSAVYGN